MLGVVMRVALYALGTLSLLAVSTLTSAGEDSPSAALSVSGAYRYVAESPSDSVLVFVQARNVTGARLTGCFMTTLTWQYEASDSVRTALRIDSLEAAGALRCRWSAINLRFASMTDDPFNCRDLDLEPGQVLFDTLCVQTGAQHDYPGTLEGIITIWNGREEFTWAHANATSLGSCPLVIRVPRDR